MEGIDLEVDLLTGDKEDLREANPAVGSERRFSLTDSVVA